MTCVATVKDDINVFSWVGADSLISNGYMKLKSKNEKVFHNSGFPDVVVGVSGSMNGYALKYVPLIERSILLEDKIDYEYMVTSFIETYKEAMTSVNAVSLGQDGSFMNQSSSMLVYRDQIFALESDFSVFVPSTNYYSVGSGSSYALGSLFSTEGLNPIYRLYLALQSSIEFAVGCDKPIIILNTFNYDKIVINEKDEIELYKFDLAKQDFELFGIDTVENAFGYDITEVIEEENQEETGAKESKFWEFTEGIYRELFEELGLSVQEVESA